MWIVTKTGFLSVVRHRERPHHLMVRARVRADLEALESEAIRSESPPPNIVSTPGADYPFRLTVHELVLARVIAKAITDIDYPNFKNAAPPERHDALLRVWGDLHALERLNPLRDRRSQLKFTGEDGDADADTWNESHFED